MKNSDVKAQIKSNFQSLSFEDALKANMELRPEYERIYGKRSYTSLAAYYEKHQPTVSDIAAESAPTEAEVAEPIVTDEFEEDLEKVEPDTTEETTEDAPKEEKEEEEVKPYSFANMENFNKEEIEELLKTGNPTLKNKCAIIMSFEISSDFDIQRNIQMFVGNNGHGWDSWEDVHKFLDAKGYKNERKIGSFADSKACYPIGTKIVKAWGEWVGYALQKFYLDRIDSDCKVEYVEFAD